MSVAPLVRRVIVCRKVTVTNPGPNQLYHLHGVVNVFRPRAGVTFPYREKNVWVFVQYADGAGTHSPTLELVRLGLEAEDVVATWQLPPIHLTAGRFMVLTRAHRLAAVPLPDPGVYEFRVRCGVNLGSDEIRVEDRP